MATTANDGEAVEHHSLAGSHCEQVYLGPSVFGCGQQVCQSCAFVVYGCIIGVVLDCRPESAANVPFRKTSTVLMQP